MLYKLDANDGEGGNDDAPQIGQAIGAPPIAGISMVSNKPLMENKGPKRCYFPTPKCQKLVVGECRAKICCINFGCGRPTC